MGKIYTKLDDDGFPIAFYDDAVYPEESIPNEAIEITEDQWQDLLNNQGSRKFDADTGEVVDGQKIYKKTWDSIKLRRNALLLESDWTQVPDSPLTAEVKEDWALYRQALRDLTDDFASPDDVVFPDKPE